MASFSEGRIALSRYREAALKRSIIPLVLLLGIVPGSPALSDWKASVDSAIGYARDYGGRLLDATREYGDKVADSTRAYRESWFGASPRPVTDEEIEAQRNEQLRRIWGKTLQRLDEVRDLDARIETAPESRWFGEDRESLRQERGDVFATLAQLLEDPHILEHRAQIEALQSRIDELNDTIGELQEQRVAALEEERASLDQRIVAREEEIAGYRRAIGIERANLQRRFRQAGLTLDDAQLTALLARVDADDLIGMAVTFQTLSAITSRLMELMQASGEELRQARRYYGMYVALLEFVLYMQDSYLDKLAHSYLPRIDRVLAETRRVQSASLRLLSDEHSDARKAIVRQNIAAQRLTLEVAKLYRQQLEAQKKRVEQAREVVQRDYRVARNTYDTVRIGADLVRLMQVSQEAFAAVMSIQIPDIAPFENLEMQRKFEELSRLIGDQ